MLGSTQATVFPSTAVMKIKVEISSQTFQFGAKVQMCPVFDIGSFCLVEDCFVSRGMEAGLADDA